MKFDVKYINGEWIAIDNTFNVPEGTVAELIIKDADLDIPPRFRVNAFDVGKKLAIAIKPSPDFQSNKENRDILQLCENIDVDIRKFESYSFVKVSIDGGKKNQQPGSWFEFKDNRLGKFICSAISFPEAIKLETVSSLNHAYTVLSELIEPQRSSHTGNVYTYVFYEESDGKWYPLRNLREKKHQKHQKHQKIAEKFWARYQVSEQIAFS